MNRYTIAYGALTLLVAGSVMSLAADKMSGGCQYSKSDIAQATVTSYAYEAYPSWASAHPGAPCPRTLAELNEYMNNKDTRDPWGDDYVLTCDGDVSHLVVASAGPDGRFGTADDVLSR